MIKVTDLDKTSYDIAMIEAGMLDAMYGYQEEYFYKDAKSLRRISEILDALEEYRDKVAYQRSKNLLYETYISEKTKKYILNDMTVLACKILKECDDDVTQYEYNDFEYGVICGKLAILRWVLGDKQDNFDV
ncbi:MAG: hypothetical protein DRO67_03640 [Candidatus Asgardarchaeum californiense]|nr:MAG: hypothetical protein DRO67_03640 [Candidatus Asgardarchaeum californiense]